jgi:hypothetical protein
LRVDLSQAARPSGRRPRTVVWISPKGVGFLVR